MLCRGVSVLSGVTSVLVYDVGWNLIIKAKQSFRLETLTWSLYVNIYVYECISLWTYICMCVCMHVCMILYMYVCMYACMHDITYAYVCAQYVYLI